MGRPKGSKNKPKSDTQTTVAVAPIVKKGPASKPALAVVAPVKPIKIEPTVPKKVPIPKKEEPHVVVQFTDYVIDRMDVMELDYYKRHARKIEKPMRFFVAKSILDFFRIHDQQLDLTKLLAAKE